MKVTLKDCLELSAFSDARVLAGRSGLTRDIRSVSVLEAGDSEGASNEFLLAGSWSDARERSMSLTYAQAEEYYNAGDLKSAQPLYSSIPDYQDARWKDWTCRWKLAQEASKDLEYSRTLELLKDVPDDFENVGSLRAEAAYQKARLAIRQEDWAAAYDLLSSVNREYLKKKHADAESLYVEVCKRAGKEPYPEGTPEPEETPAPDGTPAPEGSDTGAGASPEPDPFLVTED